MIAIRNDVPQSSSKYHLLSLSVTASHTHTQSPPPCICTSHSFLQFRAQPQLPPLPPLCTAAFFVHHLGRRVGVHLNHEEKRISRVLPTDFHPNDIPPKHRESMHAYLPLPTRHRHVDEAPRVCDSLLRSALGGLFLLLRFNLYSRRKTLNQLNGPVVFSPAKWDGMVWSGVGFS